jgi:hypothetical protein
MLRACACIFFWLVCLAAALPAAAGDSTVAEEFLIQRRLRLELQQDLRLAQERQRQISLQAKLDRSHPHWYDLGGRFRRDRALRSLRLGGIDIRQMRRSLEQAWQAEADIADGLRRRQLAGPALTRQEDSLLASHNQDRLKRLQEAASQEGGADPGQLEAEKRYYKALLAAGIHPQSSRAALESLAAMKKAAGLDG